MAQDLFGVIVGGWHSVDFQEGEQAVIIPAGVQKPLSKVLSIWMVEGAGADALKTAVESWDTVFGIGE